jgi:hypothetical protein
MSRLAPRSDVLRALFARSGNRCAFPGCTAPVINERNQFIAQVCHIEAAELGGERYNSSQSDEERRDYANLLVLCYPHHVETNDVARYSVQALREMKALHERQFERSPFKIDESLLHKIANEMDQYWSRVEGLQKNHIFPELAIGLDVRANFVDLVAAARDVSADIRSQQDALLRSEEGLVADVQSLLGVFGLPPEVIEQHPEHLRRFQVRNWEVLNLGLTNALGRLQVLLIQMELKYLELFVQIYPNDKVARLRLDSLKAEFETIATSAICVD